MMPQMFNIRKSGPWCFSTQQLANFPVSSLIFRNPGPSCAVAISSRAAGLSRNRLLSRYSTPPCVNSIVTLGVSGRPQAQRLRLGSANAL